jgi:membrane fusion protein (multidrug efflux system)
MIRRRRVIAVAIGFPVALAVCLLSWNWWSFYRTHITTDDAYVRADIALVTSRIPGTIVDLPVVENSWVEAGALLAKLDPAEYEVGLRQAEAARARAIERVDQARAAARAADGLVTLAVVALQQARLDHERASRLAVNQVTPVDRLDRSATALRTAEIQAEVARHDAERAHANLGIALDAATGDASTVRQAIAARDAAALLVGYTELRAPIAGIVAKRMVEVGQRVQPGQALMMVVPLDRVYVEANFKETQLERIYPGQTVTIVADMYPGYEYRGRVESLAPGSGAAFALLPPENAAGNWVKVVQRLPVRISFDQPPSDDRPLPVSISVVVTLDVGDVDSSRTGPSRFVGASTR